MTAAPARTAAQTTYTPPRAHIWDLSAGFHGYQMEMGSRGFTLTIPYGPALIYLHQVSVTPMAYHTPYIP